MADDKKTPIVPNQVSPGEAVHDLTNQLSPEDGGWNPKGTFRLMKGRMKDGVRVFTYTLDAPQPSFDASNEIAAIHPPSPSYRQWIQRALESFPKAANIRFEETSEWDKADIRYFCVDFSERSILPAAGWCEPRHGVNNIFLRKGNLLGADIDTVRHETMHALGFSHSAADPNDREGIDPRYDRRGTVMSGNAGSSLATGLGIYDVIALRNKYGESALSASTTIRLADLKDTHAVFAPPAPLTLDLTDEKTGGLTTTELFIDTNKSIFGRTGGDSYINAFLLPGSTIQNVLSDPEKTSLDLSIVGNALPNRLQGGRGGDDITPRGGNDILSGGAGRDAFVIDGQSGRDNVITDFTLRREKPGSDRHTELDQINIDIPAANVALRWREDFPFEGVACQGTEVTVKDAMSKEIASVFIKEIKPAQLQNRIFGIDPNAITLTPVEEKQSTSTHPSGLPETVNKSGSARGK